MAVLRRLAEAALLESANAGVVSRRLAEAALLESANAGVTLSHFLLYCRPSEQEQSSEHFVSWAPRPSMLHVALGVRTVSSWLQKVAMPLAFIVCL